MKGIKKLLTIGFAVLVCVSFSGCRSIRSEKLVEDINNHSNFEIDLLTPVGECDFEGFGMIPGHGVEGYYDKKYGDITENDALNASYVQYDVTSYPDIGFGKKYVTGIYISDPEIHVYGYSVGDNSEEFSDFLEGKGFDEYYNNGRYMMCSKGKVKIRCDVNREKQEINGLYVGMDLTNMLGSMY
jgi:hypothetical protein